MTDPIRALPHPRATSPEDLAHDYAELSRRLLAILQEERAGIAELRGAIKQAITAGEDCHRETQEMREEFRETMGCIDTLRKTIETIEKTSKEYIDELEAKIDRYRRAATSMSEEAIAEAAAARRLVNTGRFDAADVRAAAADVMDDRELAEKRKRDDERRAAARTVIVSVVTAAILAMLGFICIRLGLKQ